MTDLNLTEKILVQHPFWGAQFLDITVVRKYAGDFWGVTPPKDMTSGKTSRPRNTEHTHTHKHILYCAHTEARTYTHTHRVAISTYSLCTYACLHMGKNQISKYTLPAKKSVMQYVKVCHVCGCVMKSKPNGVLGQSRVDQPDGMHEPGQERLLYQTRATHY